MPLASTRPSTSQLALARRYRPRDFQSTVGQEVTLRALMSALDNQRLHHAYLFTGTRGVGKTTLARIFAKALSCEQGISAKPCESCHACQAINLGNYVDLIEVDAASRTKVEDTRELLENVQYLPNQGRFKIYLIDEVHMLSGHSFNALLKTLEEPPSHVKFLLATTDPQKLPVTVLSRCLQFHLQRIAFPEIVNHLAHVLNQEAVAFEQEALEALARAADGSMRDALSLLDQALAYGQGRILATEVRRLLGLTEKGGLIKLFSAIAAREAKKALEEISAIANTTPNFSSVLTEFLTLIHQVAMAQQLPEALDDSVMDPKPVLQLAEQVSPEEVQLYYQIGLLGQRDLPYAPTPQMGFEMIVLRMLAFQPMTVADNTLLAPVSQAINPRPVPSPRDSVIATTSAVGNPVAINPVAINPAVGMNSVGNPGSTIATPTLSDWAKLIPSLNLIGMAKELASHCILTKLTEDQIHLSLHESQKPLWSKRNEERLQECLNQHFKRSMMLKINISTDNISRDKMRGDKISQDHQDNKDRQDHKDYQDNKDHQGHKDSKAHLRETENTPAQQYQMVQDHANQKARQLIETDPNVTQLMQKFGAKIEQVSIPDPIPTEEN